MNTTLVSTIILPAHVTASAFRTDGKYLAAGSDDGSVRLYQPPELKVRKAIRGLGPSISCVLYHDSTNDGASLWVASGRSVYRFDMQLVSDKMILTRSDASLVKDIGQDDEDVVNQLALSANHGYLACTTDNGDVYVVDLSSPSQEICKMKTSHNSIAWTACFIPDRPSELLTGGYDCALLLHDFKLRTLLARFDIAPTPSLAPVISSLPPFITSLALSSTGAVAAGTADGRIWVGLGGVKSTSNQSSKKDKGKKRTRKWLGLNEEDGFFVKLEDQGLVAGLHFIDSETLISCTVHGKLTLHRLTTERSSSPRSPSSPTSQVEQGETSSDAPGELHALSTFQSSLAKVDVLACTSHSPPDGQEVMLTTLAVAGLHADKKRGAVELWELRLAPRSEEQMPSSESADVKLEVKRIPDDKERGEGNGDDRLV